MSRPEQVRRLTTRRVALGRRALFAAGFALAVAAIGFGLWREAQNPRFTVEIAAIRGLDHTSPDEVVAAAALPPNQNAWLIDRRSVERRIAALPWVGQSSVHVSWPNHLTIDVVERRPVARVAIAATGGEEEPAPRYAVIDQSQRVLAVSEDSGAQAQLPVLVVTPPPAGDAAPGSDLGSKDVAEALAAYQRLSALGLHVSEVAIALSTGISATADRNLRVLFGEDEDLAKKAQLFQAIVAKISTPERIAYIDVRSIRTPTVLYR